MMVVCASDRPRSAMHRVYGQLAGAADGGAEEGRLGVVASSGRLAERCLLTSSAGTRGLGNSEVACQPKLPATHNC